MNDILPNYEIDARACVRCAACASIAPEHFVVKNGPAKVVRPPRTVEERYACDASVRVCPAQAITGPELMFFDKPVGRHGGVVELYPMLGDAAETVRWKMSDLPWDSFDSSKVSPMLLDLVRGAAASEQTTYTATQKFMQAFADDPDFTQWVSVWFYEETRHPMVLMRWLALSGESFNADFINEGRISEPFMRSLTGTLVLNVVSELLAATVYLGMSFASKEPLLAAIARRLAADESRHCASFFRYAQRRIARTENIERDRLDALKVLHLWLSDTANVTHPVIQAIERVRNLPPDFHVPPQFGRPDARVCQVVGQLVGLPIHSAADVYGLLTQQALRVHAVA
jgi:ferredoxin